MLFNRSHDLHKLFSNECISKSFYIGASHRGICVYCSFEKRELDYSRCVYIQTAETACLLEERDQWHVLGLADVCIESTARGVIYNDVEAGAAYARGGIGD